MNERYTVRLRKAVHVFCAGHFITLTDDLCEAVHGHNWLVGADVEGSPDAHGMVVDFIKLRDLLSQIVARLDHCMLLPTQNRLLHVSTGPGPAVDGVPGRDEVTVRFHDRRWVLAAAGSPITGRLRIEVDECLGQSAVWECTTSNTSDIP